MRRMTFPSKNSTHAETRSESLYKREKVMLLETLKGFLFSLSRTPGNDYNFLSRHSDNEYLLIVILTL